MKKTEKIIIIICLFISSFFIFKVEYVEKYEKINEDINEEDIDLNTCFDGLKGCAILYDSEDKKYFFYNKEMCQKEVSPYSTFKILATLIGLKNEVIVDENSKMNYNQAVYPVVEWNKDLNLEEAFKTSCIWYFRKIVDEVGKKEVKRELDEISYGNCDISEWYGSNINELDDLNGFWINSSLKISPFEQVKVLYKLFEEETIYNGRDLKILKNIMLIKADKNIRIYGKTGTGLNGRAWFVGFVSKQNKNIYFAVYLNDKEYEESISGGIAKEIALKIIDYIK